MIASSIDRRRSAVQRRHSAARQKIAHLGYLRRLASLPPRADIAEAQWNAIESKLKVSEERLLSFLSNATKSSFSRLPPLEADAKVHTALARIEMELPRSYAFFDTYLDILTQRHMPAIGKLLVGCDLLALDAMQGPHSALEIIERPLVYLDRGFGASTIRQDVRMPDKSNNPLPLIQIPYTRLVEKCNLTSIIHEAGHEVMVRLGLVKTLPVAVMKALAQHGAPVRIQHYFGLWMSEIGPDFWTFCNSGLAAAAGIREILALPDSFVFRVSPTDPHPPPYLRALLNFEWCRQVWGHGIWDGWEEEWKRFYLVRSMPKKAADLLLEATRFLPVLTRILLHTRFKVLGSNTIINQFDMERLAPARLEVIARQARYNRLDLRGLRPCAHLAVFRLIKELDILPENRLEQVMALWLTKLRNTHFQ